jgi:hypothetical protein
LRMPTGSLEASECGQLHERVLKINSTRIIDIDSRQP